MPISIEELKVHLRALGHEPIERPDAPQSVVLGFNSSVYRDAEGDSRVFLVCSVSEEGDYLEISAPRAYSAQGCKFKGALFAAMLEMSFRTQFLQFEYDSADGEVRLSADLPVEDGTVTPKQIDRMIGALAFGLETFDPVIRHAMATGRVDFSLASGTTPDEPPRLPAEIQELLTRAGGLENLRRLVEEKT